MKKIIPILLTFFIIGCNSNEASDVSQSTSEISETQVIKTTPNNLDPQVALDFINGYVDNCNKMKYAVEIIDWATANQLATDKFKHEVEKMATNAWKEDPELGLGFDPIFDAQDYPEEGFELLEIDTETGYLTIKGINTESFTLTMKIIHQDSKTLVDGCGVINISEDKRAKRL